MASEVILPRVDMDMATGLISQWHVAEGDAVEKGQVLFDIETDKAAMEVEAEASGVIRGLSRAVGEQLPVGTVVAWICAPGETFEPPAGAGGDGAADAAASQEGLTDERSAAGEAMPDAAMPEVVDGASQTGKVRATPLARRLARQNELDIRTVTGTGPRGRVSRADVVAVLDRADNGRPVQNERLAPRPVAGGTPAVGAGGAVRTLREGTGAPLLLIHGFGGEIASWRPLLPQLRPGHPVLAVDLPGHGQAPESVVSDFDALAVEVEERIAATGLASFHLVGHSLGAAVAARMAAGGAFDVRSLLLIAPAGIGPAINGDFLDGFSRARDEAALATWMRLLVHRPEVITPALVRATLKAKRDRAAAQKQLADALFPDATQVFSVRHDLARADMPLRLILGIEDRIIPPHYAAGLPATVAVHRLPGVGHMPQWEAPELTGRLIGETLLSAG